MKVAYETMFLLPPTSTEDQVAELLKRIEETIGKRNGEFVGVDKMGVRRTAYGVNKMNSAYYILVQYRGSGETIKEVERTLKNTDTVLKFLSTKITTRNTAPAEKAKEKEKEAEVPSAAAAGSEPPKAETVTKEQGA